MKIDIPFYSQYSDDIEKDWQNRSCAIVCLQMVLDFYKKESKFIDLIKEGLSISEDLEKKGRRTEGYTQEFGWGHELLIMLLKNNGVLSYRQDFKNPNFESKYITLGLEKIRLNILDKKPVIVSMAKDINNPQTSGHMIVVSGIESDGESIKSFYINNPENEENKNISIEDFKKVWKKLAIFVN